MANTELDLTLQSRRAVDTPLFKTRVNLRDDGAVRTVGVDWDEPAADRVVTVRDPGGDDDFVFAAAAQNLTNKTAPNPTNPTDIANKSYVDSVAGGGVADATSGSGGAVKGVSTADSDKGLEITGGASAILAAKVTAPVQFDGGGNIEVALATSAPAGGTTGIMTADEDEALLLVAGNLQVKTDGTTIQKNGSGELEVIGGGGGGPIGLVSQRVEFFQDIVGGFTPPNDILVGTDVSAQEFPQGADTGLKAEFQVPQDYFSGALEILLVERMDSASGSNQIRLQYEYEIVDVSGGSIGSTGPTGVNYTTLATTDFRRQSFLSITAGTFAAGDTISFRLKRIGTDGGNDLHPGDFNLVAFEWRYTAIVDQRVAFQAINFFENALGETPTVSGLFIGTDIAVESFITGADSGLKVAFIVPDNWDEASQVEIRGTYAMSSAAGAATVRLETTGEIVDTVGGTINALGLTNFDFSPPNDTDPHSTGILRTIPASALNKGDSVKIALARRVAVGGNHAGDFYLVNVSVVFRVTPASGFTNVQVTERHLPLATFTNASGAGVFGDTISDLGGDFAHYDQLRSTVGAGVLHAEYEGRLAQGQTEIASIKLNFRGVGGSPQYILRVYAEGTGQVYASALTAAPGAAVEVVLTDLDLSAQPAAPQFRYFVVVEAAIDVGEQVLVSRPFVRQE